MCWWSKKDKVLPRASREAMEALKNGRSELLAAQELRSQVHEVQKAASSTLAQNHFGVAITAAMGGPIHREQ